MVSDIITKLLMAHMQEEEQLVKQAFEDAKIKELYSKATANIARAREDHSRSESNLGLYEERLSMIERNRSMSLKEKQEALAKLLENIAMFGQIETTQKQMELEFQNQQQIAREDAEKREVEARTGANQFLAEIMGNSTTNLQQQGQQAQAQAQQQGEQMGQMGQM